MMKKLVATVICIAMVVSMSAHVFATQSENDPNEHRSVEEILNEYHEKSFATQNSSEPDSPASYSRQSETDSKTLEEETVEALNAAGYEAYNVTASNYETLEETLQTDLTVLGLNPNGSYIVVVSGEDSCDTTGGNARDSSLPEQDIIDGGGSTFTYTYNGVTYTMRYVTITSNDESCLRMPTRYSLSNAKNYSKYAKDILSTVVSYAIDEAVKKVPLGTILSLAGDWATDDNLTVMNDGDMVIFAGSAWVRNYIQIWSSASNAWHTAQCSAYVNSTAYCAGLVYNSETNAYEKAVGNSHAFTTYSAKYYSYTQRKADAVGAYLANTKVHDCTGDIGFYLLDSTETININGSSALFTHEEPLDYLLPIIDYD